MTSQEGYSNEELSKEIKALQKAVAEIRRMLSRHDDDESRRRRERCW